MVTTLLNPHRGTQQCTFRAHLTDLTTASITANALKADQNSIFIVFLNVISMLKTNVERYTVSTLEWLAQYLRIAGDGLFHRFCCRYCLKIAEVGEDKIFGKGMDNSGQWWNEKMRFFFIELARFSRVF